MSTPMQIVGEKDKRGIDLRITAPIPRHPSASPTYGPNQDPNLLSPISKGRHNRFASGSNMGSSGNGNSPTIFALSRQASSDFRSSPTESPRRNFEQKVRMTYPDGTEHEFSNFTTYSPLIGTTPRSAPTLPPMSIPPTQSFPSSQSFPSAQSFPSFPSTQPIQTNTAPDFVQTLQRAMRAGIITGDQMQSLLQVHANV